MFELWKSIGGQEELDVEKLKITLLALLRYQDESRIGLEVNGY